MEELGQRKDLLITNADKDCTVAIMETEHYIKEASRQYLTKQVTKNKPKTEHYNIIEWFIKQLEGSNIKIYILKNYGWSKNK